MMVASTAMSAGGAAMSNSEARKNAEARAAARNRVLQQSLDRQAKWGEEARGLFDTRLKDYTPETQGEKLATAQEGRTTDITKNMSTPTTSDIPLSGSAPQVVKGEIAKRMLASFQQATDRAKAAGKVGGYSDNWLGNNTGVADTARQVGTINNFSQMDNALLGSRQELAEASAPQSNSIWGPLLSGGGSLVAAGAGRGWNPFGGSSTGGVLPGGKPLGQGGIGSR